MMSQKQTMAVALSLIDHLVGDEREVCAWLLDGTDPDDLPLLVRLLTAVAGMLVERHDDRDYLRCMHEAADFRALAELIA